MALSKAVPVAGLFAAETRLAACVDAVNRKKAPSPSFSQAFRLLRAFVMAKPVGNWQELAHATKPGPAAVTLLERRPQLERNRRCRCAGGTELHRALSLDVCAFPSTGPTGG